MIPDLNTKLNYLGHFNNAPDFPKNGRSGDMLTCNGHMYVWVDNAWTDCGILDVSTDFVHTADYNTCVVDTTEERIMEKVKALLKKQKPVFVKMTCHNCGAGIYQKAEDHIFKCKFCRTTYLVGTEMIRDGLDK